MDLASAVRYLEARGFRVIPPDHPDRLTASDIAAELRITTSTWRAYVARGTAPQPDGWLMPPDVNLPRPYWTRAALDAYKAGRRAGTADS